MPLTPIAPHRSVLTVLRTVLIAWALLGYRLLTSSHDHDAPRTAEQGLCAICVYGGGTGATLESVATPPPQPLRAPALPATSPRRAAKRILNLLAIRGPPQSV
jgi:hypothetical protein